jgi:hypothetical protein
VVAPLLQRFPELAEEVKVKLPPSQKVVGPEVVIVGVIGFGLTVTDVAAEAVEVQVPVICLTVKLPEAVTEIVRVVAPLLQRLPEVADEVKVTPPPSQKVVGPKAVIVGVLGFGLTVTDVAAEGAEVQELAICCTE